MICIRYKETLTQLSDSMAKQPFNVIAHKRLKKNRPLFTEAKEMMSLQASKEILQSKDYQAAKLTEISEIEPSKGIQNRRFSTYQTHFSSHSKERNVSQKLRMNQTVTVKPVSLKQS